MTAAKPLYMFLSPHKHRNIESIEGLRTESWQTSQFSKKGKRNDPGNDPPVSLASVPGKIMEKIIL